MENFKTALCSKQVLGLKSTYQLLETLNREEYLHNYVYLLISLRLRQVDTMVLPDIKEFVLGAFWAR